MKCTKCGNDIPENAVFCSYCGIKLSVQEETVKEKYKAKKGGTLKTITAVFAVFGVIVLLIALLKHKTLPIVFVILEFVSFLLVRIIHKGKLLCEKIWPQFLFLLLGFAFTVLSVQSFGWGTSKDMSSESEPSVTIAVEEKEEKTASIPFSSEEVAGMDYVSLKAAFEEKGFTNVSLNKAEELKYDETDKLNAVKDVNIDGNSVFVANDTVNADVSITITYYVYAKCKVNVHVEFLSNLFLNKYDVNYSFGSACEGVMSHGENLDFEVHVEPGEYKLLFTSAEDSAVTGEIPVNVKGDMNATYGIHCSGDEIMTSTVYIEEYGIVKESEIMMPDTAFNYTYFNYKECESVMKELGFTNIKAEPVYDIVLGITDEGATKSVSINGNDDFNKGDVFSKDAEVIITYHMNEDDDPNRFEEATDTRPLSEIAMNSSDEGSEAIWYSTNDYETAKNGNSGVFSYINRLSSYDIYYIIDFDEGTVYYFTEGNGNGDCDRVKIESGNLNDAVTITYHIEGEDDFSYRLYFKYKNMPSTLIVQDNDGFYYEFMTTDLSNSLKIRDTKRIVDY